jgi:hypothetical protein
MWRKWCAPNNASKEQMGFNSGFKGLNKKSMLDIYEWKKQYLILVSALCKTKFFFK